MQRLRVRRFRVLVALACVAAVFPAGPATAQSANAPIGIPAHTLDGRRFSGEFVPTGKTSGRPDEFVFAKGKFYSRECLTFGFEPGPYWTRTEDGRQHFLVRLTSPENGVMTYEGTVIDGKLDARIEWIKPRWYWTMKRDFRFRGVSNPGTAPLRK